MTAFRIMTSLALSLPATLARRERRRHAAALALTLPLLVFLLFTLLVPIGVLLLRAVQNPEVVNALPRTAQVLESWDGRALPQPAAFAAVATDLASLTDSADAGTVSRRQPPASTARRIITPVWPKRCGRSAKAAPISTIAA